MKEHDTNSFAPRLSLKGERLFNIPALARESHPNTPPKVLASGARYSTKTWSVEDLIVRHLWETPGARFVIFATAVKTLSDAGPWKLLTEYILPEWIDAGIGLRITTKNRDGIYGGITDSKTRTIHMKISNFYGGESEIQLNSIQHAGEIEEKLKSTMYSGVWFSELKQFPDPSVLRNAVMALRMPHLEPWQHLLVADTNPADEGPDSWIYQRWFLKDQPQTSKQVAQFGEMSEETRRSYHLIEFFLDDNPFISEERKQAIRSEYMDDPLEYQREILGLWVKGLAKNKLFAHLFSRNSHIIGVKDNQDPERSQIQIANDTDHLYSGWDLGSGINHAAGIIEKRILITPKGPVSIFCILGSLKQVGEHVRIQDFTLDFMQMKKELEGRYPGRAFSWTHFSDDSAINQPRASGAGFDYLEVMIASKNDIVLTGVPKPKNSVGVRIRLVRRLLRENRLFSYAAGDDIIAMLEEATSNKEDEVEWNEHKHVFDWVSYVLYMLCFDELEDMAHGPTIVSEESLTSVPL